MTANIHTILECFYVLKDNIIQKVEGVSDVRNGETFNRFSLNVYIPNNIVPLIIGKNGVAIDNIRSIAYTKVLINTENSFFEEKSLLIFEGDKMGIPQAFYVVFSRIMTLNPRLSWIYPDPHRMSALTETIQNVTHMSKSDDFSLAYMRALNPNIVTFAFNNDSKMYIFFLIFSFFSTHEMDAFLTFRLDSKKTGAVIGPAGSVISQIRKSTSTQIYVGQDHDNFSCRHVEVTGKLANILEASQQIVDTLKKE